MRKPFETFSPLLIGEVVVTDDLMRVRVFVLNFQSPLNRGSGCNFLKDREEIGLICTFSPLLIGEVVVTGKACPPTA